MRIPRKVMVGAVVVVGMLVILEAISDQAKNSSIGGGVPSDAAPTPTPASLNRPLVLTYYFYWYDALTGGHLEEPTLRHHPPDGPAQNWYSEAWHKKELTDMVAAGIDVVLPVFWGSGNAEDKWSTEGLSALASAWDHLRTGGANPPRIGMFLDTTIVKQRDLTTENGRAWFYQNFREFFERIPRRMWSEVAGGPIIFLFTSDWAAAVDQSTFDYAYEHFQADFGVRPYIVREVSWDYPILRWERGERVRDYQHPIVTENSYLWAGSIHGFVDRGGVAVVGPGYDDRHIPSRGGGRLMERRDGQFYLEEFGKAIKAHKPLLVIETWNEFHEGSGISETREFGRQYIELTRRLADEYKASWEFPR